MSEKDKDFWLSLSEVEPRQRIVALRKKFGLTQKDLADIVGVHWITISRIERGEIGLSDSWIGKITQAMKVNKEDFEQTKKINDDLSENYKKRGQTLFPRGEVVTGGRVTKDFVRNSHINDGIFSKERDYYDIRAVDLGPFLRPGDVIKVAKVHREIWPNVVDRLCIVDDISDRTQFIGILKATPKYQNQPPHLWDCFEIHDVKGKIMMRDGFSIYGVVTDIIYAFSWHDGNKPFQV